MRVLASLFLAASALYCQTATRDQRWRDDLRFFASELQRLHPNLYGFASRQAFDTAVAQLNDTIPEKTDAAVTIEMARIAALAGDGHTFVRVFTAPSAVRRFPLRAYWFKDGLYVTQAAAPYLRALGKQIVRIDNTPVAEAYTAVTPFISHENDAWVRFLSPDYLVSPDVLSAARITADANKARYTFADGGTEFSLDVEVLPDALASLPHLARPRDPLYRRYSNLNYWFEYLPESRTLYLKYNRCQDQATLPFARFAAEYLAFLDSNPVARFVFDLRNNQGGNSSIIDPLVLGLAERLQRGALPPDFKAFAIIGRETFSSGMLNASQFKLGGVPLAGEPTGGKPTSYGENQSFALPNARLGISCSTRLVRMDIDEPTLTPDLLVEFTAADFFDERDPVLEAVLAQ